VGRRSAGRATGTLRRDLQVSGKPGLTPWMRAREVFVHAVDLDVGITFADLPVDFTAALRADIRAKRMAAGERVRDVRGASADVTSYLAGRLHGPVTLADGTSPGELGAWL
jgi:maleylpyruvate isomerase